MEIRPSDLMAAARGISDRTHHRQRRLRNLQVQSAGVHLHHADPMRGADDAVRLDQVLAELQRCLEGLEAIADELNAAAIDALTADAVDDGVTTVVGGIVDLAGRLTDLMSTGGGSPTSGDAGGTFSTREVPFPSRSEDDPQSGPLAAAPGLVVGALDAMADEKVLAHDEFGLIHHDDDRYTVVLPGVTDLTRPERGWNPIHRSPRDLDMAAVPSARSTGVDGNAYASAVAESLEHLGVPPGAELVIIGHSFGAETALDLATDEVFSRRHEVTHVVATGYFSQPQLSAVPSGTEVLVVQNRHDIIVHATSVLPRLRRTFEACELEEPNDGARYGHASIVRFRGDRDGFGHSSGAYRQVFSGDADLRPEDATAVADFLTSIDDRSAEPPTSMVAVDISLTEP